MQSSVFTAITFSPVTEFIEKTRKLRDLYGSSFILSYLADSVCRAARKQLGDDAVISPALLNITMGTPDQIVIQGDFPEKDARKAFGKAWAAIMDACHEWVVDSCDDWISRQRQEWGSKHEWHNQPTGALPWDRSWDAWRLHAWEFFWVQRQTIPQALDALAEEEGQYRNWVGINWLGESSTLSGADAIAWPGLDRDIPPKQRRLSDETTHIRDFFKELNQKIGEAILEDDLSTYRGDPASRLKALAKRYDIEARGREEAGNPDHAELRQELAKNLGEAIITNREQLSIPELTKRLFTLYKVAERVPESEAIQQELPDSFRDVNLWKTDQPMGWFRGDGDRAGDHIRRITQGPDAVENLHKFSYQMRSWGQGLKQSFDQHLGRIVFAGGDDFLGVFYPAKTPQAAIRWLCQFKAECWHRGQDHQPDHKPITPSVGFVWASPQVPQRDILQHCELAEQTAKGSGRDRVCFRVLFSSGTYLEWTCPWWLLPKMVRGYRDRNWREHHRSAQRPQNWTHIYNDVAALKARHGFQGDHQVALAFFNLYFADPDSGEPLLPTEADQLFAADSPLWAQPGDPEPFTGILSEALRGATEEEQQEAFSAWVISLAEVGFHLFNGTTLAQPDHLSAA
jgi:CRISPR-associated protein Cmr2